MRGEDRSLLLGKRSDFLKETFRQYKSSLLCDTAWLSGDSNRSYEARYAPVNRHVRTMENGLVLGNLKLQHRIARGYVYKLKVHGNDEKPTKRVSEE